MWAAWKAYYSIPTCCFCYTSSTWRSIFSSSCSGASCTWSIKLYISMVYENIFLNGEVNTYSYHLVWKIKEKIIKMLQFGRWKIKLYYAYKMQLHLLFKVGWNTIIHPQKLWCILEVARSLFRMKVLKCQKCKRNFKTFENYQNELPMYVRGKGRA